MNFGWLGGRKNIAFMVVVVSAYIQATVLERLQVDLIMAAGVAFMGANALKEVAFSRRGQSTKISTDEVKLGPVDNVSINEEET